MAYSTPTGNYQAPNFSAIFNPLAQGLAAKDTLMANKMKGDFLNQQAMNRESQRYALQKERQDIARKEAEDRAEVQQREGLAERIQATMLQAPNLFEPGLNSFESNPLMNRSTPELMALEERLKAIPIDQYHRGYAAGEVQGSNEYGDGVRSMLGAGGTTLAEFNDRSSQGLNDLNAISLQDFFQNLEDFSKAEAIEENFANERMQRTLDSAVALEQGGYIPQGMINQVGPDGLSQLVRAAQETADMDSVLFKSSQRNLSDQDKSILLKDFMDIREPRTAGLAYVQGLDPQRQGLPEYSNFVPYLQRARDDGFNQRSTGDLYDQFMANQYAPRLRQHTRTIENQGEILRRTGAPLVKAVGGNKKAVIDALTQMLKDKDETTSVPKAFQSSGSGFNKNNVANQTSPSDLENMEDAALALLLLDELDYDEIQNVLPTDFNLTQAQIDYANARKELRTLMSDPKFQRLTPIMDPNLVESLGLTSGSMNLNIGGSNP